MSKYFNLAELTHSDKALELGVKNEPGPVEAKNLERLMAVMDIIRERLGAPVIVSSGYRSLPVNRALGSKDTSAHLHGLAIDFTAPKAGSPLEVCRAIAPWVRELGIDQLIHENGRWIHLGLREDKPRHQLLTITGKTTRAGLV